MIEILFKCDGSERLNEVRWRIGDGELPVICGDIHTWTFMVVEIDGDEMRLAAEVLKVYGVDVALDVVKFFGLAAMNLYASLIFEQFTVGWGQMRVVDGDGLDESNLFKVFCEELDERAI